MYFRFTKLKVFCDLLPFFILVGVYFVVYKPFHQLPPETFTAAWFKVLPVWYLAFLVFLRSQKLQKNDLTLTFSGGLVASSLGDASLIWRNKLFILGMLFFAVAHVFYIYGLSKRVTRPIMERTQPIFVVAYAVLYLFIAYGIKGYVMKILVFIYSGLVVALGWLATSRFLKEKSLAAFLGAVGAILFIFSDFTIGINKWRFPVPMSGLLVMVSYYGAQLCLCLSTITY